MSVHLIRTLISELFPFRNLYCFSSWILGTNLDIKLIAVELIEMCVIATVNTEWLSINFFQVLT